MLMVGAAFATMLIAITNVIDSTQARRHTREELVVADRLEKLVVDLETGLRGYVITGKPRFIEPWNTARLAYPAQARKLSALVVDDRIQRLRVPAIVRAIRSYVRDYSIPLMAAVARHDPSARSVARTAEGKRRIDQLRERFEAFRETGGADLNNAETDANRASRRALVAAGVGVAGSVVLILLFTGFLGRAIVRPIRRAAAMADRIAGGDLAARMPEEGPGEVGALERSFNVMANSLQRGREELQASRSRVVATADETRRRIERDLHDGAQQRLILLAFELRGIQDSVPPEHPELAAELARVAEGLTAVLADLREFARGIHPGILAQGGLAPALKTLARRSPVPVDLDMATPPGTRLPERVEVAAYYVVAEALANAAKHAGASKVTVRVRLDDGTLRLSIRDDGKGGAHPADGSGLIGLNDRVEAIGGSLAVDSPAGAGTTLLVELPLAGTQASV